MSVFTSGGFWAFVGVVAGIYTILALGIQLQFGFTGLLNFGQVAFMAIGAYTMAILVVKEGWSMWLAAPLGVAAATVAGLLLGLSSLRLRADYFAIVTLGVGEMLRLVALNEDWLTKGALGLTGIPRPLGDVVPPEYYQYFLLGLSVALLLGTLWFLNAIARSPFGRVMRAVREGSVRSRRPRSSC